MLISSDRRVTEARILLEAAGAFLHRLAKIFHRKNRPPPQQAESLGKTVASLGVAAGGIGARSAVEHVLARSSAHVLTLTAALQRSDMESSPVPIHHL